MLAVALNSLGTIDEEYFASLFVRQFTGFKVIKLSLYKDAEKDQLQVCQPEKDADLLKDLIQNSDPADPILRLKGPRAKLQKAVRSMFFPGQKKKHEKVLLIGSEGFNDFPWAVQIVAVQLNVLDLIQDTEELQKSGFMILHDPEKNESENFIVGVKTLHPENTMYVELYQGDRSKDIKKCYEVVFAEYLVKRKKIKERLEEQHPGQVISCAQAGRIAGELRVSTYLVGSVCDEYGYQITNCGLGCF
ncbi:hypothetical protein [Pelotomaculum propionicicum]|uniref:Uncharacterized protein n=1 Tax=Pelotomaculum propionicicum TaxID=258475 RepID=A0A4Y7RLP7_9FIRM|nr:hypothetical protein [Pelotomaculum propionicicum]TEB09602.1 hypothetical protein Pmgp_03033 [Pelotomaculum propionicicum]